MDQRYLVVLNLYDGHTQYVGPFDKYHNAADWRIKAKIEDKTICHAEIHNLFNPAEG